MSVGVGVTAALWWWAQTLSSPPLSPSVLQVSVILWRAVNHTVSTLTLTRRTFFAHSRSFDPCWSLKIRSAYTGCLGYFISSLFKSTLPFLWFFCPFFYSLSVSSLVGFFYSLSALWPSLSSQLAFKCQFSLLHINDAAETRPQYGCNNILFLHFP